jgi:putrescine transport system substrate-binding protein
MSATLFCSILEDDSMTLFPRNVQRTLIALAASVACLVSPVQAAESKVLNIYNWSDYIGPNTIANFEKETGIKVRYDNFDTNEILHAKLVAGKTGYDLVVPSSNWAKVQLEGGLLMPIDKSKVPNLKNLDPNLMKQLGSMDPGNAYLTPWLWGITTLGINVDKVKAAIGGPLPENVWDLIFKPEYVSKLKSCGVSMLDSADEVFPAAMRYVGKAPYSKNSGDYQAAAAMLKTIRPHVTLFSSSGYINDMAGGSICLALGWNGDINIAASRAKEAKNGQNIVALVPSTGAVMFFDTMAIPADAANPENAHKFLNYILRPEVNAELTNKVFYANGVPSAAKFIKPEVASNKTVFMTPEDLAKMAPPEAVNNDIRRLRTRLFTTFKTGR